MDTHRQRTGKGRIVAVMADDASSSGGTNDNIAVRGQSSADRDRTAEERDEIAAAHDQASAARDDRAEARDHRAEAREQTGPAHHTGAAADRAGAKRDRRGGASDRTQAADDREAASADRALSAQDRAASSIDELTLAHRRDSGYVELEREISRATRTKQPLVVAFIDVNGLKSANDSRGHAAGDQLLRAVADTIRAHIRDYDLLIRFGGDEFVCALPDLTIDDAAARFAPVNTDLEASHRTSVTVGLTKLASGDSVHSLVARADEAMYTQRKRAQPPDSRADLPPAG